MLYLLSQRPIGKIVGLQLITIWNCISHVITSHNINQERGSGFYLTLVFDVRKGQQRKATKSNLENQIKIASRELTLKPTPIESRGSISA